MRTSVLVSTVLIAGVALGTAAFSIARELEPMIQRVERIPDKTNPELRAYKDVGFDGAAVDEFEYMTLRNAGHERFRGRFYTDTTVVFTSGVPVRI
jgi:hypothetical protein